MSSPLAPQPPRSPAPATVEGASAFRVNTAALSRQGAPPAPTHANMVVVTDVNGVVVYPPSDKLVILAARRARAR